MLNSAGNNSFSDLVSVYLRYLTIKLRIFDNLEAYSNSYFLKFRILEIFNFHPCEISYHSELELCATHDYNR